MTLTLELSPEEEERLLAASRMHGVDPSTYAKQLVTNQLPEVKQTERNFDDYIARVARRLPVIPADKQTREFIA